MTEKTSYGMAWETGGQFPILTVTTWKKYRALGPLSFSPVDWMSSRHVWHMDFGHPVTPSTPTCETIEEMLEKGWIEEIVE